jgi:hypothetical protein
MRLGRIPAAILLALLLTATGEAEEPVKLQIDPDVVVAHISPDFIGLGYETSAVAQPGYFSAKNQVLARLYGHLNAHGMIRVGGIISDHARYVPDGVAKAETQDGTTIINRANLEELGEFARATGWTVMWGLNLGTGTKEEAVQQAQAVNAALGGQLHSFEIGNEVDALKRFSRSYDAYHSAFLEYKAALRAAMPTVAFSGPDTTGGGALPWVESFAATEWAESKLLTSHYYRGGAGDPRSTLERLLARDDGLSNQLDRLHTISNQHGVAYRINETNSFYGGGKAGVSDTFGSALWCLDYLFALAAHGCAGVNLETDLNQLGFISHYSPIVHDSTGVCSVRAEYYGMLAFARAGTGDLLKTRLEKTEANLMAYATKDEAGVLRIVLVNKDLARDATIEAALPAGYNAASAVRLAASFPESTEHATFAGAEVTADGEWTPNAPEKLTVADRKVTITILHASALVVELNK